LSIKEKRNESKSGSLDADIRKKLNEWFLYLQPFLLSRDGRVPESWFKQ